MSAKIRDAEVKLLSDVDGVPIVVVDGGSSVGAGPLDVLTQHDGLLIREKLFWSQVFVGACEKRTQFTAAPWSQVGASYAGLKLRRPLTYHS